MSATIFSWLHLSDIHFGHGDAEHQNDQQLVLDALASDVVKQAPSGLDAIFVTGDIAFSGATRNKDEYTRAEQFIGRLLEVTKTPRYNVFCVPGNHDVVREPGGSPAKSVLNEARGGQPIDEYLANADSLVLLRKRFSNYLGFARGYNPACGELWWSDVRRTRSKNVSVRIIGLNSALLCNDEQDKEKLQVGKHQLTQVLNVRREGQEVTLVLMHHPLEWLHPKDDARGHIRSYAHILLSGHLHNPDSELVYSGAGGATIRVSAGATHSDSDYRSDARGIADKLPPFGQSYSVGSLRVDQSALYLDIAPRAWSGRRKRFQLDADDVPDGASLCSHLLPTFQVEAPDPIPTPIDIPQPGLPKVFGSNEVMSLAHAIDSAAVARLQTVEEFLTYVAGSFERLFDLKRNSLDVHPLFKELKKRLDQMTPGVALREEEGVLLRAEVRHVILRTETILPLVRVVPPDALREVARPIGRSAARDLIREVLTRHRSIPANPAAFVSLWDYWDRTGGWGKLTLESSTASSDRENARKPRWRIRVDNSFLIVKDDLATTHQLAAFWCGYIHGCLEYALPEIEKLMLSTSDPVLRSRITFPAYVEVERVEHLADNVANADAFEITFRRRPFSDSLEYLSDAAEYLAGGDHRKTLVFVRSALAAAKREVGEKTYAAVIEASTTSDRDTCRVILSEEEVESNPTIAARWHTTVNQLVARFSARES